MKNNYFKKIKIILMLGFLMFSFNINSSYASGFPTFDIANFLQNAKEVLQGVDQAYQTVKTVYQTTKTATAVAQSVQNFNMSQLASSLSSDAMTQVGDIVTKNLGTLKDPSTNIFTNGQQVITDLNGYLNKSTTNAIKKTLDDFQGASSNPYQSSALSDTIKQLRNNSENSVDKLKVVDLASIAQKEICNNTKLKDVIKNGEPSTWINPKPALKNVNIDELCNADLSTSGPANNNTDTYSIETWNIPVNRNSNSNDVKNLKAFLFDKGYFITVNSSSIYDSATIDAMKAFQKDQNLDQSGEIDDLTQTAMLRVERQSDSISGKAAQAAFISIANAGYGGSLTRNALADPSNSPLGIQTQIQSEINKQITDAQFAATNKYSANGGVVGNEKCLDKDGNIKQFDPTDPSTAYCDNTVTSALDSAAKIKADIDAARQSPYLGILAKANNTKDCSMTDKTLQSICKNANKANEYLSLVNNILGIAATTNSSGGASTVKDSQYAQLAASLDNIQKLDQSSGNLANAATASTNNYNTSQSQALTVQNNGLADNTTRDQANSSILSAISQANSTSTPGQIDYNSVVGQSNNTYSQYSNRQFDYDNSSSDRDLLNNLMSIVKVSNIVTNNTQTLSIALNSNSVQDWGIDSNLIGGTYKIISKNTGKTILTGDISNTGINNKNLVTNNGQKFRVYDAYILDNLQSEIDANGGIKNVIVDTTFNIYFRTLNTQKNSGDFSVNIGFYIDGSKY